MSDPNDPHGGTVADYQELIRNMITNDEGCQSPHCRLTMMGHLLDGQPDRLVDLVKALDPSHTEGGAA